MPKGRKGKVGGRRVTVRVTPPQQGSSSSSGTRPSTTLLPPSPPPPLQPPPTSTAQSLLMLSSLCPKLPKASNSKLCLYGFLKFTIVLKHQTIHTSVLNRTEVIWKKVRIKIGEGGKINHKSNQFLVNKYCSKNTDFGSFGHCMLKPTYQKKSRSHPVLSD